MFFAQILILRFIFPYEAPKSHKLTHLSIFLDSTTYAKITQLDAHASS